MHRIRFRLRSAFIVIGLFATAFAWVEIQPLRRMDERTVISIADRFDANMRFIDPSEDTNFSVPGNGIVAFYGVQAPGWFPERFSWLRRQLFTRIDRVILARSLANDDMLDELAGLSKIRSVQSEGASHHDAFSDDAAERFVREHPRAMVTGTRRPYFGTESDQ